MKERDCSRSRGVGLYLGRSAAGIQLHRGRRRGFPFGWLLLMLRWCRNSRSNLAVGHYGSDAMGMVIFGY